MPDQRGQHPADKGRFIGRDAQFGAIAQSVRQEIGGFLTNEAASGMPLFRPRIRKQQHDPAKAGFRQDTQNQSRVINEDANVAKAQFLDENKKVGDAVDIGLAPDQANPGIVSRHRSEMLAAAKPDFKPNIVHCRRE